MDVKGAKKFKPIENMETEQSPVGIKKSPSAMTIPRMSPRSTRFSHFASNHGPDASSFDFEEFDHKSAKALYRKLNYQTAYQKQYGEPPKAAEDFQVMKQKKFRDIEISRYFEKLPTIYVEKWLLINENDELISQLYFTCREMFTVIKNMDVNKTTNSGFF